MKANQKGFSVVEILIVIVVVGLLGAVGWLVNDRQKTNNSQATQSEQKQETTKDEPTTQQSDEYAGWKVHTDSKWKLEFKYPADWSVASRDFVNGGNNTREITLKSPDFKSNTENVIEDINAGAVITVSANDTDMTDFSATGLKDNEAYKETTVAGVNAVYYIGRGKTFSYALIKDKIMYNLSLRTVEDDNTSENTYKPIFEKLVKSFQIK